MARTLLRQFANKRVIQRNLVYVMNLSPSLADENLLMSEGYFGQYGSILKCKVKQHKSKSE